MAEADLKFDEQIVCTKLAKEYLNSKTESHSLADREEQVEIDQLNKTIFYVPCALKKKYTYEDIGDIPPKILALLQKIEENVQLFCQLEFLLRKIPINDTKDVDLKLITQSLLYKGSFLDADDLTTNDLFVCIAKDTPLYYLGLAAYHTHTRGLVVVCTEYTVAVCTLFVQLCRDVGLKSVNLSVESESYSEDMPNNDKNPYFNEQLVGCVGVVTARCDLDSAMDDLLAATTRYPWKLSGVLVQEAALERFMRALEWKTRGASPLALEPDARGVPVQAFRSVREALLLIEARAPLAVAAWAGDLAEANEIAFGARAPLVWLNGHGHFRGPPAAAAAVYFTRDCYERILGYDREILSGLIDAMQDQKYTAWRELAPATRVERIREALEKFHARSQLRIGAVGLPAQSTVAVDRGVCVVTRTPVKCAIMHVHYIFLGFTRFLNYLVAGGTVHVVFNNVDVKLLCDSLSETGVPVFDVNRSLMKIKFSEWFSDVYEYHVPLYTIKAIWTSSGTIFAN